MFIRTCNTRTLALTLTIAGALLGSWIATARAESMADWGPAWDRNGKLLLPEHFRHWVFLGSPLTPNALNGGQAAFPEYHNVYVQPQAFAAYRETGQWPEGTIMLKELQLTRQATHPDGSSQEASGRGFFPGTLNGIDISVKDSSRFRDTEGWGFFNFGHHAPPYAESAAAQPAEACAGCHMENATNMVFSKFYAPILDAK
ncbi:cytochrome P460 family protein [Marinobacterium aestuariivivens]|uniref:Cytochrome P460 family protein n=1 Tax=Marinobacterium aestuariivivens TaxID=1698799 RepID=A0ABW2A0Z1_9GAMM